MAELHRTIVVPVTSLLCLLALSGCAHVRGGGAQPPPSAVEVSLDPLDRLASWDSLDAMLEPIPEGLPEGVVAVDGLLLELLDHHRTELERVREVEDESLAACHHQAWKLLVRDARRVQTQIQASEAEEAAELQGRFAEELARRVADLGAGELDCVVPAPTEVAGRGGESDEFEVVDVFYGTDRARSLDPAEGFYAGTPRCPKPREGSDWDDQCLEVGVLQVSIPADHEAGEIERPTWWKLERREDPSSHVILRGVEPLDRARFVTQLKKSGTDRPLLVFVHGYNTDFEEAAWRAAQMVHDLREYGFGGRAALYSWASRGTLTGYPDDEQSVEAAVPHLAAFLDLLATESGGAPVHLVAHSMGNRALTGALGRIGGDGGPFEQVLLAAPDIDAARFVQEIVPQVIRRCARLTLYASANDNALRVSGWYHDNHPRAGDTRGGVVSTDLLESIDASRCDTSLLGHSYVAERGSVLMDVAKILEGLALPERATWLEDLGSWWQLHPLDF